MGESTFPLEVLEVLEVLVVLETSRAGEPGAEIAVS